MAKRNSFEVSISGILQEIITTNKLNKGLNNVWVQEAWHKLLGNGISNYTQSIYLKDSTLFVSLSSSVVREELSYGKSKIIKMLNEELKQELIKEIVFR